MKKISCFIIVILLFPCSVLANDSFEVSSCDIEISINKDNNFEYNETVDLQFKDINVLATKELPSNAKDLKIDKDYFLETSSTKLIKIYSNEYASRLYNLKYTLKNTETNKNKYTTSICSNYNGNVSNIEFHINLPNQVNKNNVKFLLNNTEIDDINYKINGKEIIGNYHRIKENSVLSVEIDYDAIYYDPFTIACIIIPIIFAILSGLLWKFYGKDLKYKVSRISKLPNSINLLDMALVNDGVVTEEEAYYMLLDLANRGYLKIIEHRNGNFTITKGKEYDGKEYIEAAFLKALFRKTIRVSISEYIEAVAEGKNNKVKEMVKEIPNKDIPTNFKRACSNILGLINANEEKNQYFESTSDEKKYYLVGMIAIILVLVTSLPFLESNLLYLLPLSVLFSVGTLYVLIKFVSIMDLKKKKNRIEILVILSIITMIVILLPAFNHNKLYIVAFAVSIVCVAIILFFYKYMPKRTIYGTKVYAKIEGFKEFLDNLREEDLVNILEHHPNYLYDILASAYILDRGELIIRKIKDHEIKEPSWYIIEDEFTPTKFSNSIQRLKKKIQSENEEQ